MEPTPVEVAGQYNWSCISVGAYHTCGTTKDGGGWCWGAFSWACISPVLHALHLILSSSSASTKADDNLYPCVLPSASGDSTASCLGQILLHASWLQWAFKIYSSCCNLQAKTKMINWVMAAGMIATCQCAFRVEENGWPSLRVEATLFPTRAEFNLMDVASVGVS
jgi:hypothetical protein